jgi:hypothetical protein
MATVFNLRVESEDVIELLRPHDDFVLTDPAHFRIIGVDMVEPAAKSAVPTTDPDYPFVSPVDAEATQDGDGLFKVHTPKLKAGDQFRGRLYMILWQGAVGTSGPHFRIDP